MEELIRTAPRAAQSKGDRALLSIAAVSGLGVMLATSAVDLFAPLALNGPVGAEATQRAAKRARLSLWDGSRARALEDDWREVSRVRQTLAPYWSALLLRGLESAPSDVIVGKDDWLFMRDRQRCDPRDRTLSLDALERWTVMCDRRLAAHGTRLVAIPIVRKAPSCPEVFPSALDCDPDYEQELLERFAQQGVETFDIRPILAALPVEQRYLRADTHWHSDAADAVAEALAERYDTFARPDRTVAHQLLEVPAPAGLLPFASIPHRHPAQRWFDRGSLTLVELEDPEFTDRMATSRDRWPDGTAYTRNTGAASDCRVALAGSSFTDSLLLAERMACAFRRPIYPGGELATPFAESLARMADDYAGKPFPEITFFEFPVHQAFVLYEGGLANAPALGHVAKSIPLRVQDVPSELVAPAAPLPPNAGAQGLRAFLRPGTFPTSGDGVLQLRLELTGAEPPLTQWTLRSSCGALRFELDAEERSILLPVVELQEVPRQPIALFAQNAAAREVSFTLTPCVDSDLAHATELEVAALDKIRWRGTPPGGARLEVDPQDVTFLDWTGQPGHLRVFVKGRTAVGTPVQFVRDLYNPRARFAVLGMGPLQGGTLEEILLVGHGGKPLTEVRARIAPQLDAR